MCRGGYRGNATVIDISSGVGRGRCLQPDLAGPPQATQTVGRKEAMAMLDSTPVT